MRRKNNEKRKKIFSSSFKCFDGIDIKRVKNQPGSGPGSKPEPKPGTGNGWGRADGKGFGSNGDCVLAFYGYQLWGNPE